MRLLFGSSGTAPELLQADAGHLDLHTVDHRRGRGGDHGVALLKRDAGRLSRPATFGGGQPHCAHHSGVVELHGLGADHG